MNNSSLTNFLRRLVGFVVLIVLTACQMAQPQPTTEAPDSTVLTSVGPIYSITSALLENTNIQVINVPEQARTLAGQPSWFARRAEPFQEAFENATAVVTMGNLWENDPLFIAAREQNISIINIDATLPYSSELTGVSVLNSPSTGDVSPYFWLSPANIIRSGKIISNDLTRLFPDQAETIRTNEQMLSSKLLEKKTQYEIALAETDSYVYALADEFAYLTTEFGIFVEDYFVKQDINWTEEDLANLTSTLSDAGVQIVIHKWEPSEEIQAAIAAAGSKLVVLDTYETSTADIETIATGNLDSLIAALPKF